MTYTLDFQDPMAARIELSGGKGSNLALLSQRGFPVPNGFVVTAQCYRDFIVQGCELVREIVDRPAENAAHLREQSDRLRASLRQFSLPPTAEVEIREKLSKFSPAQTFSVRSSSTMEDLASAAFAGQHDTFLNCSGADSIIARIRDCFLSLWADRAIAYRHQQHFDHWSAAMAVVVQEMVSCDVAGVAFSINPVNGNLNEIVVDANFGIGESVVSGETPVDHFVIDRSSRTVLSSNIALKTSKVVGQANGTAVVALCEEEGRRPCLTSAQLSELAQLILRIEASYRFPQDIEWGFADGRLALLQSRPITTIPPRWTRDESAERFPNVITPLTWDFVEIGFHRSLEYSFRLMGFPAFNGKWFEMHDHYIYGNQNAVELYGQRAPFVVRNLEELRAVIPTLRDQYWWVQELPVAWMRDLDQYLIQIGEFMAEPLESKSIRELWSFVLHINEFGANYFLPNIAISITHATLYRLLHLLLQRITGPNAESMFDKLMAFCETRTGVINKELFELALLARNDAELQQALFSRGSREFIEDGMLERFPAFSARFQKFLRAHGHREMDFDAYAPTWNEVPWIVLDNVQLILKTPMDKAPADKELDLKIAMQQAELELFQKLPQDLHFFFAELLRLARLYTSLDDLEHYQTTRLTPVVRRALREMGSRLVEAGVLSEPMDVFFAHLKQLDDAVAADTNLAWQNLATIVRAQKADYLRDKAQKPSWVLGEASEKGEFSGELLSGLPGSPGIAEGPVYMVKGPEDFANFPKGAVLVARTTNPTWTPLFYSAIAVVTESGGPLSHGAVTAREMSLPAVMSVKDSLLRLRNGQIVRVDGNHGTVSIVQ